MGNAIHQIRAYVSDMLAATRRLLDSVGEQVRGGGAGDLPEARWLLERLQRMLATHAGELAEHLRRLGAVAAGGSTENATLATGLMDAAAHRITAQPTANALRDDYTALSLAHAAALMLETNARALGFSSTAALATRHREEILTMLERIRELLPSAVQGEIAVQEREKTA